MAQRLRADDDSELFSTDRLSPVRSIRRLLSLHLLILSCSLKHSQPNYDPGPRGPRASNWPPSPSPCPLPVYRRFNCPTVSHPPSHFPGGCRLLVGADQRGGSAWRGKHTAAFPHFLLFFQFSAVARRFASEDIFLMRRGPMMSL